MQVHEFHGRGWWIVFFVQRFLIKDNKEQLSRPPDPPSDLFLMISYWTNMRKSLPGAPGPPAYLFLTIAYQKQHENCSRDLRIRQPTFSLWFLSTSAKEISPRTSGSASLPFPNYCLLKTIRKSLPGPPDLPSFIFLTISYWKQGNHSPDLRIRQPTFS